MMVRIKAPAKAQKPQSEAARLAAARREEKARAETLAKLARHQAAVERSEVAVRTGAVTGRKKERRRVFNPEAGRYRMARVLPQAYAGMPSGAPHVCPKCGANLPSYVGQGRYHCRINRLARKLY